MTIHPIEERYGSEEMRGIFSDESRLQRALDVEAALARAHAELGNISQQAAEGISKKASLKYVKPERVREIRKRVQHGIMAIVLALTEVCEGDAKKYVHFGASSYDISDTALALQLKDSLKIMLEDINDLENVLLRLVEKHKATMMIGRTHGQHAAPTTFGFKLAVFAEEIKDCEDMLEGCKTRLLVGKMGGAVGTLAAFDDKGYEIQERVMRQLGLKSVVVSGQAIPRGRYAEFMACLGILAGTLEKIAKEIRNLQRSEIAEVEEAFAKEQVGSSTMPHKRNPILSERVCGLARIVQSNAGVALENVAFEHEGDLTNLVCEQLIIPETCLLIDEMLKSMKSVLSGLRVYPERMMQNLATSEMVMSEAVMIELTKKGVGRQEAHELIRRCAMETHQDKKPFKEVLLRDKTVKRHLNEEEIDELLNPERYLEMAIKQVEKILKPTGKARANRLK